jgi:hypothetical protein
MSKISSMVFLDTNYEVHVVQYSEFFLGRKESERKYFITFHVCLSISLPVSFIGPNTLRIHHQQQSFPFPSSVTP